MLTKFEINVKESKKTVRILHIIGNVCGGGVEAVVMNYYRYVNRDNVQFDFVVNGYEKSLLDSEVEGLGGRVYRVEPYQSNMIKYMLQLYRIVKVNEYRIVHTHMNALAFFSLFPAWLAGARIRILHNHSTAAKQETIRTVLKFVLKQFAPMFANSYIACSQVAAAWMYGNWKQKGVRIIKNAIDTRMFAYDAKRRGILRRHMGIGDETLVIGHVGRFAFQKNHDFLIKLFKIIHDKKHDSVLLLIGDGSRKADIETKVKDAGIYKSVRFLGLREDINDLYNVMDIFILPSWYEGLPVVAVEAQANGLPCMLSDRITEETQLLDSTKFYSITADLDVWVNALLDIPIERAVNAGEKVASKGFDIRLAAAELEKYYLRIL